MPRTYDVLPAYVKPDLWLDENNCLEFIRWKDETEPYQAMWWHRANAESGWCFGGFMWRKPDASIHGPLWDVASFDPLTVSPSLLCLSCGVHGFIREGKWVPA